MPLTAVRVEARSLFAVPSPPKAAFYPALDGLRALAVALVFLFHFLTRLFPFGWIGVQIFFVLSGFLITGILADTTTHPHHFKTFYARRALRIFPLYFGMLLLWSLIVLATHGTVPQHFWLWWVYLQNFFYVLSKASPDDLLSTAAGHPIAAIGHLWTLAIEEQFYLLWPLVVFLVKDRRRLMQICCAGILLRIALAAWWQTQLSPATLQLGLIYRMLPTQCDGFLMGGFLALWLRGRPSPPVLRRSGLFASIACLAYTALLFVLHLRPNLVRGQDVFSFNSGFQAILGIPLVNLASFFLIAAALSPQTWVFRLFHLATLRSLGRVSYGLYFFHLPIYVACRSTVHTLYLRLGSHGPENLWHTLIATLLTVAVAYASFYLFERRFLDLKKSLRFSPHARPHARQGTAVIPERRKAMRQHLKSK